MTNASQASLAIGAISMFAYTETVATWSGSQLNLSVTPLTDSVFQNSSIAQANQVRFCMPSADQICVMRAVYQHIHLPVHKPNCALLWYRDAVNRLLYKHNFGPA